MDHSPAGDALRILSLKGGGSSVLPSKNQQGAAMTVSRSHRRTAIAVVSKRPALGVKDACRILAISFVLVIAHGCKLHDNSSSSKIDTGAETPATSTHTDPTSKARGPSAGFAVYGSLDTRPTSSVAELIKKLGANNSVPELRKLLKAESPWERIDAAEALRQFIPGSDALRRETVQSLTEVLHDKRRRFGRTLAIDARFNAAYALLRIERSHPALIRWAGELLLQERPSEGSIPGDSPPSWVPAEAANLLGKSASHLAVPILVSKLNGAILRNARPLWARLQWKNPASEGYALHYAADGPAASIRAMGALRQGAAPAIPQLHRLYDRLKNPKSQVDADVVTVIEILDTISEIGETGDNGSAEILIDACATADSPVYNGFDVDMIRLTSTRALELFFTQWCQANSAKLSKCPLWKVPRNYQNFRIRLDIRKQEEASMYPDRRVLSLPD